MFVCQYLFRLASHDEVFHIISTEIFLDGEYGLKCRDELVGGFNLLLGMQTVVTIITVAFLVNLSKIVEQHLPSAYTGLGIRRRFLQQLSPDILFSHGFPLHKLVQFLQIFVRVERQTESFAAVAPCPTRFLIIPLKALGDIIVDDKAYVGLVDAHSEGDGCHNHVDAFHEEIILGL